MHRTRIMVVEDHINVAMDILRMSNYGGRA
jgi:hypothetical protein